jgi:hypothetical protein
VRGGGRAGRPGRVRMGGGFVIGKDALDERADQRALSIIINYDDWGRYGC